MFSSTVSYMVPYVYIMVAGFHICFFCLFSTVILGEYNSKIRIIINNILSAYYVPSPIQTLLSLFDFHGNQVA